MTEDCRGASLYEEDEWIETEPVFSWTHWLSLDPVPYQMPGSLLFLDLAQGSENWCWTSDTSEDE